VFDSIQAGKFVFRIRAVDDLNLPVYKGSTLRGGFGSALKAVTCALKRQDCATCLLRDRCVYLYLFETPPPSDSAMMRLYPAAPHPFIIEPPETENRTLRAGQLLDFALVLVGRALDYLPYFVYAFVCLGENGLGRVRGRFALEEVLSYVPEGSFTIYSYLDQTLRQAAPSHPWEVIRKRCLDLEDEPRLSFRFHTPVRLKFDGHLVEDPQFHHLIRSVLRRLSSLSYFHCSQRIEADFRGLIERAKKIERTAENLTWHDWERYSSRQKQRMSLGGFVGTATFTGDMNEFLPLLAWSELLHLGKAASFGLGRFEIQR
jgi:hypothetical protein